MSIIIAILVLGFIIFIHEFGHFIVAKFFKVPVREFSIGMGPRVISKVWHNTRYSLKALPFGGSCAMTGEDPAGSGDFTIEGGEKTEDGYIDFDGVRFTEEEISKNNFSVISPIKKFFICFAGPFNNFLLAFLLAFVIVSMVGFDIPLISGVAEDSAASAASPYELKAGDQIIGLEIPGEKETIISYRDLSLFMQLNNDDIVEYNYPLIMTIKRDKNFNADDLASSENSKNKTIGTKGDYETFKTVVYPRYDETYKKAMIGISFENVYQKPSNVIETAKFACEEFYFYIKTTVMSLRLLIRGKIATKDISGPVGTVAVMGDAIDEASTINAESMIYTLCTLIVLISANLGVMNLLPIPALDGGRIVFAAIEMIIGRPIDKNIEAYANAITMVLLLIFMVWIFGLDIYKLMTK